MARWKVAQGEYLASIALENGFPDWKKVLDHPDNAELKKLRGNDGYLLLPGDELELPDDLAKKPVKIATGKVHRFVLKVPMTKLRIKFFGDDGKPIANKPWTLMLGRDSYEGTTDGDGFLEQALPVSKAVGSGTVVIDDHEVEVRIGHLNPVDTVSGLQSRLHNLGFDCGPVDGELGDVTAATLKEFQKHHEIEETGELDDTTKSKLKEVYGA